MEKLSIKEEDLEFVGIDGGGIPIYNNKGKPFTGIIEDYFFDTAILAAETEYIKGYQDGLVRGFYKNGDMEYECYKKTIYFMEHISTGMSKEI